MHFINNNIIYNGVNWAGYNCYGRHRNSVINFQCVQFDAQNEQVVRPLTYG